MYDGAGRAGERARLPTSQSPRQPPFILRGALDRRASALVLALVVVLVVGFLVLVLVEVEFLVVGLLVLVGLLIVVEFVLEILGLQGEGNGEALAQRGHLGPHLGERRDEILLDVRRGLLAAMGAHQLLRPLDEILSGQLEGALALLAGEIDRHVRGAEYPWGCELSTPAARSVWLSVTPETSRGPRRRIRKDSQL